MWTTQPRIALAFLGVLLALGVFGCAHGEIDGWPIMPEQRSIQVRDLNKLPQARVPNLPPPPTVTNPQKEILVEKPLSLDEAIRIGLANSQVVRVLTGVSAASSGRTIYDPAISNTIIDQEKGIFDPNFDLKNTFDHGEPFNSVFDAFNPQLARIVGSRTDSYELSTGLSKRNFAGGTASLNFTDRLTRFNPGLFPLNPENRKSTTLRLDQPLLQGASIRANLAPIVIARLNTERSFFQFKSSVQDMVKGVIEGYWAVVFARTDVKVREQQVALGKFAYERAEARLKGGLGNAGDVAQAQSAYANFKASLIGARANLLQREAALRNILGLPPSDGIRLVPITPPLTNEVLINWEAIIRLAEERRPDLIDLKLIIEADQQQLQIAENQAYPKVDTVMQYQWNGINGTTPSGASISSDPGQFTNWTLGLNVSLPLGLRAARASLRRQQLILARDWANLDQGLHFAIHELAGNTRNIAQFLEQYKAFKEARQAAYINLQRQAADYRAGRSLFLNVLQAITDWGNAVSAEAQSLAQYNTELANLERTTGTILETHGVFFYQERFAAIGPLGRLVKPRWYPESLPPGPNAQRYPTIDQPSESIFDLRDPFEMQKKQP